MTHRTPECIPALIRTLRDACQATMVKQGSSCANPYDHDEDAYALRRIAMTLHNWHELECGTDRGAIERDEKTSKPYWYSAVLGKRTWPVADKEAGAIKRLKAIMARYPGLGYYIQGDPRGASLYILRPGDVPKGEDVDAYYNRGIAVYK